MCVCWDVLWCQTPITYPSWRFTSNLCPSSHLFLQLRSASPPVCVSTIRPFPRKCSHKEVRKASLSFSLSGFWGWLYKQWGQWVVGKMASPSLVYSKREGGGAGTWLENLDPESIFMNASLSTVLQWPAKSIDLNPTEDQRLWRIWGASACRNALRFLHMSSPITDPGADELSRLCQFQTQICPGVLYKTNKSKCTVYNPCAWQNMHYISLHLACGRGCAKHGPKKWV